MPTPTLTNTTANYTALVTWALDSSCVYRFALTPSSVAAPDVGLSVFSSFIARALPNSQLVESIGIDPLPKVEWPEFSFSVAREDNIPTDIDQLISDINTYYSDDTDLYVYLTDEPANVNENDLIFAGYVEGDGIEITRDRITVRAKHSLSKYDRDIPSGRYIFDAEEGDPDARGKDIPILYGNWADKPSEFWLPCTITNRLTEIVDGSNNIECQLCQPNDNGIGGVYSPGKWLKGGGDFHGFQAWAGRYSLTDRDLDAGTLELYRSPARDAGNQRNVWQKGDEVFVCTAQGNLNSSFTLITDPVDIIYDLLTEYAGVPSSRIGDTITPGSGSQVSTGFAFRALLDKPQAVITDLIQDICQQAGLFLYISTDGCFEVAQSWVYKWNKGLTATGTKLDYTQAQDSQRHTPRPMAWEYDGVDLHYKRNPSTGKCTERVTIPSISATSNHLKIESDWIWREKDARAIAGMLYEATKPEPYQNWQLELTLPFLGLGFNLNDQIRYTGEAFTGKRFYICRIARDFGSGETTIIMNSRVLSWYAASAAPNDAPDYDAATNAEKRNYGWATDTDGTIDGETTEYSNLYQNDDSGWGG